MRELEAEKRKEQNATKNSKRVQIQEVDTDSEDEAMPQSAPRRVQIQEVESDSDDDQDLSHVMRSKSTVNNVPKRVQIQEVDSDDDDENRGNQGQTLRGAEKASMPRTSAPKHAATEGATKGKETISAKQKIDTKRIQIQEVDDDSDSNDDASSNSAKKQPESEVLHGAKRIQIQEVEDDSDEEVHVHKAADEGNTDSSDDDVVVINKNSAQESPSRSHRSSSSSSKGEKSTHKDHVKPCFFK